MGHLKNQKGYIRLILSSQLWNGEILRNEEKKKQIFIIHSHSDFFTKGEKTNTYYTFS